MSYSNQRTGDRKATQFLEVGKEMESGNCPNRAEKSESQAKLEKSKKQYNLYYGTCRSG